MTESASTRRAVLSLGGNVGDVAATLQDAVDLLSRTPATVPVAVSPVYRTAPVGKTDQPDFLNLVLVLDTELPVRALLERCHAVEQAHGRVREEVNGPRTLDVDVIAVDDLVMDEPDLVVPHPRAHQRAFVLVPWLDVDPRAVVPGHGAVADLVAEVGCDGVRPSDVEVVLP